MITPLLGTSFIGYSRSTGTETCGNGVQPGTGVLLEPAYRSATPEEVDAATRGIVRIGKPGGRYLFAASDFLEKNTPIENVIAMLTAASDEGGY